MSTATTLWLLVGLVVALIVGPFATLRAVEHVKRLRKPPATPPAEDDDQDKTSWW